MIEYSKANSKWTLTNACSIYEIGLKDNKCHHILYAPKELANQLDIPAIMLRDLQPEAEIHINDGSRTLLHGARWLGCNASSRAEYIRHEITGMDDNQLLTITSEDKESGLEIDNCYRVFDHSPAISRYVTLRNMSEVPIDIQHLGSFTLYGIPFFTNHVPGNEVLIHSFPSSWCWEGQMKTMTAEEAGLYHTCSLGSWHIENTGSWSSKEYMPFFIIEERKQGIFWCVQIEHSASWRFEIGGPGPNENGLYLQGGLGNFTYAHWSKRLMPGEQFESARVSLLCTAGSLEAAINAMHEHRANVLIHRSVSDRGFPVIFNEWISTQGKVRQETIEQHIEALEGSGIEVYVIDAGWYMPYGADIDCNKWYLYAGDWEPHPSRFPAGIRAAADQIKAKGMIPGIWLEMEVAGTHSKAYTENQHLFMKNARGNVEDNTRRFLYFGNPETREYALNEVEKLIEAGFGYFKLDYNSDLGLGCVNSGDSLGEGLNEHIKGYYAWLDDLRRKHPKVIIESCSGGGNRLDYGMLSHTDLASITDQIDWFRLCGNFFGVSKVIHPSQMGVWSVVKDDFCARELIFVMVNSMMGRMHVSGEFEKLDQVKKQIVMESIHFYKQWRAILEQVKVYHHTDNISLQYTEGWLVLQMNSSDSSKLLLGAWRLKSAESSHTVKMKEIDAGKIYKRTAFPKEEERRYTGSELEKGFPIVLNAEFSAVVYGFEAEA